MIAIKPHHFVDIITKFGEESPEFKSHPYGHHVHVVAKKILDDRDIVLRVELGADAICQPCDHNKNGMCDDKIDTSFRPGAPSLKREWNLLIDKRWCEKIGIKHNDQLTAREFCKRIKNSIDNLRDIYLEIPKKRTSERKKKLKRGIIKFLEKT